MGDPAANGDSYIDVLIIGGGPAGVMGALALARAGVQVRIVDKRDDRVRSGHADGIWVLCFMLVHPRSHTDRHFACSPEHSSEALCLSSDAVFPDFHFYQSLPG
jgi:2-polyprenyl-6-methoxyphenol hydroxylase-like FAD-dependent oxidoreductase